MTARHDPMAAPPLDRLDNGRIGRIYSINTSAGGVPKNARDEAQLSRYGVIGDAQNDQQHHGGPERAICIYSLELIRILQQEGHPIDVGTCGENLTVEGISWEQVVPGVRIRCGDEVQLEVASFTKPCKTIKGSFIDGWFTRISQKVHPGWSRVYARVLTEGEIHRGDPVRVISPESSLAD
jgi:MOSC domain-containing protein YiiM